MQHSITPFHIHKTSTGPMNAAAASSLVNGAGELNMRKLQQELVSAFNRVLSRPYAPRPISTFHPFFHTFSPLSLAFPVLFEQHTHRLA